MDWWLALALLASAAKAQNMPKPDPNKPLVMCAHAEHSCRTADGQACLGSVSNALPKDMLKELKKAMKAKMKDAEDEAPSKWISRGTPALATWEKAAAQVASTIGLTSTDFQSVEYSFGSGLHHDWGVQCHQTEVYTCAAFPYISSILYLDDLGPPMVLFSKTLADIHYDDPKAGPANDTTFLSWPKKNNVVWFSGDMYQGLHIRNKGPRGRSPVAAHKKKRMFAIFNFYKHAMLIYQNPKLRDQGDKQCWDPPPESLPHVVPVPLVYVDASETQRDFEAHFQDSFGSLFEHHITYRVPGDYKTINGCKIDKETWTRACEDGVDKPFVGLTSSLKSADIWKGSFRGGLRKNTAMFEIHMQKR